MAVLLAGEFDAATEALKGTHDFIFPDEVPIQCQLSHVVIAAVLISSRGHLPRLDQHRIDRRLFMLRDVAGEAVDHMANGLAAYAKFF
ncbi:MAG TPA: hypothetical protein DIW45_01120 [Erythrobacter sp.]|nr:hypothetical protein [Erythrobacter sp.]